MHIISDLHFALKHVPNYWERYDLNGIIFDIDRLVGQHNYIELSTGEFESILNWNDRHYVK